MIRFRAQPQTAFPTQGEGVGWVIWALLCFITLAGFSVRSSASTFVPNQTTFSAIAVGQTSAPAVITLTATNAGVVSTQAALTEGISTPSLAEFAISDPGTCGANPSLSVGQSCTVGVTFSPRYPGLRHGAILLKASGGQLLASALISGTGKGGLPVLVPGQINTVAGDGQWYYEGDNVPATSTAIYLPSGLAVDGAGNLYLADAINNRIRRVDAVTHIMTTVAGTGQSGFHGDGGAATSAEITNPSALVLDGAGNLYFADTGNDAIRRVDAVSGIITTVAGTLGQADYTGDGGPATSAKLRAPQGLAITPGGDLLIADTTNAVLRLVTANDGYIQTVAGTGTRGYNGDRIPAQTAQLNDPSGLAIAPNGAIAIADLSNNRVRLMTIGGTIATVAGNGTAGYSGDDGVATQAELQGPAAVAFDPAGDLLIADSVNNCIRLVFGPQNTIVTLSGTPSDDRYAGDGGPENQARMHGPDGLFFDGQGNIWLSDRFNNRVREVSGSLLTIGPYPTMKVGKTSEPVAESMLNAGNDTLTLQAPVLQQAKLDTDSTTCGQSPMGASVFCNMGVQFAPQNVGPSINGSITWNSDAPNVTPIDQLYGEVLSVEPTTVAVTSSANPGLLGQPLTLTATVTSDDTGRTGTVDFVEGGTTWCSGVQLAPDGTATCQIASLALGTHNIIANYSGDNNNAASQSPAFTETIKQQAALALAVSTSPAVVTSNVVLSISAADTYGTPTGSVIFYDGANALATVTLDGNGNGSWPTSALAVGTHTITAQYSGDGSNLPETSSAKTLVISQASTSTVLSSGNNDATVGANVTLTAKVVTTITSTPSGDVQFMDGATLLGAAPLNNGSASITLGTLSPGTHTLTAVYGGDTDDATSTSAPVAQVIEQIGTGTTLGADVNPLNAGATLHLTAIVSLAPGATSDGDLSGLVTFRDSSTVLGSAPINTTGQATLSVSSLAVGAHHVVASFSGSTNYAASNSTVLSETVQQTGTAVALTSASTATLMGKPASFSALVTSSTGIPTGSISFKDGSIVLGTSPVSANGMATYSTTSLSAGNHVITAVYNGDANYTSSVSASVQQTVNLAQTSLALSGPATTIDAGLAAQFVITLTTAGVSPVGTITLLDGTAVIGTAPVSAAGNFTFNNSQLSVGTHHLTASYSGDSNNSPASSAPITVTVQQAPTATVLTASANPLTAGNALNLTATVTSVSPNPGNSVSFYDGSTSLGTVALGTNGTAAFVLQNATLGLHSVTAVYSGDVIHAGSTSAAVPELVVQSSSIAVSSSANPSVSGQEVTFTAQLQGSPVPTGSVAFRDNGATLATVPVNATGAASFATSALAVGSHAISMVYSGDQHFATATGQLTQTVLNASTITTLTSSVNPATYGQPVSLAVAVASNGGRATGTVNFTDAGALVGTAQLDASSDAVLTIATLSPGAHQITAQYIGDGKASSSTSSALVLVVKQITTLVVSSDANPAQTLSAIHLTAAVTNAGVAPATGTVTFTDGAAVLGTATLDATGHATLMIPQLSAGTHAVHASYAGDGANFGNESANLSEVVQLRPTTTTVTGANTDTSNPQQVTLIAVVHGAGTVPPSGAVNFTSGDVTLGAAQVDATGVATITVIFETTRQQVVASYAGDVSYAASQSALTQITAGAPAQFSIALSNPTITLVSHQHTTVTVTVGSIKSFTDTIELGCVGLPYAATCTFDKTQLKLAPDGAVTASLIVDTGDPLGAGANTTAAVQTSRKTLLCLFPGSLLMSLLLGRRRRKIVPVLLTLLFGLVLTSSLSGCSGLQMSGTPPGKYSFQIIGTGKGSNVTEAQAVTLVVTQ